MTTNTNRKRLHVSRLGITMVLVLSILLGTARMAFALPNTAPLNYWTPPASIPIVFAVSTSPNLDVPNWTVEDFSVIGTLNDSLFHLDKDGLILPLAATGYTVSPNKLVYTVTLRAGALWSDGQPVTAQHFVDGILRMLDPNIVPGYEFLFYPIKNAQPFDEGTITDPNLVGVKALNTQTLEFTLEQPTSHFSQILASPFMLPTRQDVINLYGGDWTLPANYVNNGPYELSEYDNAHIVIDKSISYNGPVQAVFSQMAFTVIDNTVDQILAYKNGTVDVLLGAPLSQVSADPVLKNDLNVIPNPGVSYIGFFTQVSPTNNPLVRKALASAVDRQILIDDIMKAPWRVKATGVIPPELPGYQGSGVGYSYNPVQAQAFLTQAGYPGGAGFPALNFVANTNSTSNLILEEVAAQWESTLGITVNINYVLGSEIGTIRNACRQDPSTCIYNGYTLGWFVDYQDANNMLNDLFSPDSSANYTQWDNSSYRALLNLAALELNSAQRINYFKQAEKILVEDDAAVMPLYYIDGALLVRPGIYPYYSQTFFQNIAYWSNVDPPGDGAAAQVINASGGTITAENNSASIAIPPNALNTDVSISVTDLGGNYQITTSQEEQEVLSSFSVQPHGLQFNVPATLSFSWDDTDNDGIVDGTTKREAKIMLIKDGAAITPACEVYASCDMTANTISVEVSSLSHFELIVPVALFSDVVPNYWAWSYIERLYNAGITGGCGTVPLVYCPETTVTRSQMAVFLLRGIHGSTYNPPAVGASTGFGDVPTNYWAASWIKQLAAEGITGGCGSGNYCPEYPVTRDQMAVFLLRSKYGSSYSPPAVGASTGFGDVPTNHWAAAWIKQLVAEGITSGCGAGNYCPDLVVTRAQMAVFLVRTFGLP